MWSVVYNERKYEEASELDTRSSPRYGSPVLHPSFSLVTRPIPEFPVSFPGKSRKSFILISSWLPYLFFVSNRDSSGFLCLRSTTLGFCLVDAPDVRVLIYEFTRIPLGCPTPTNARGIRSFTSDLSCYFFLDFSPNYGMSLNLDPSVF